MKYFSCFSWIGGFELWIIQSYDNIQCSNAHRGQNWWSKSNQKRNEETGKGFLSEKVKETCSKNWLTGQCLADRYDEWPLCVGFSEIDKYATQIYQSHFPNHKPYGDITKIDTATLPDFDILVWGFPCQAFSIAGKRRGFEDTRWTLFFELARILRAKQPRLFVFENVKGLLSHDNGKTFSTIIATIDELGYDCQWQVLNSKNHWVPQNRERVFIIWHLRGTTRPEVFPFTASNSKNIEQLNQWESQWYRVYWTDWIAPTQASQAGGVWAKTWLIAHTVRSWWRASWIDKKQNWDTYNFDGIIRRLTPTECERLQWFPDWWTEWVSDTQRYKCLGNAVTVNVIADIFFHILTP